MKKLLMLFAILFLASMSIFAVRSYTSAAVENGASITVNNTNNDLVDVQPQEDVEIKQGKQGYVLKVTNYLDTAVEFRLVDEALSPSSGSLAGGQAAQINLVVDDLAAVGEQELNSYLYVSWNGGYAKIGFDINVDILKGDLVLVYDNETGLQAYWNGGAVPPETYYLYREWNADEGQWNAWQLLPSFDTITNPGKYQVKAKLGTTESNTVDINVAVEADSAGNNDGGTVLEEE